MKVHISGRLGNQLFALAFAHFLYSNFHRPVTLVFDDFHENGNSVFQDLGPLLIHCPHQISLKKDNFSGYKLKALDKVRKWSPLASDYISRRLRVYQAKSSFEIFPSQRKKFRLYSGYFQNLSGNEAILQIMGKELAEHLKTRSYHDEEMVQVIDYEAWHIRRGDLAGTPEKNLKIEYYLENHNPKLPIVVCSDIDNISNEIPTNVKIVKYFTPSNSGLWEALSVLSNANRILIANSTFSWWAGIVGSNFGADVLIPFPWDQETETYFDTVELKKCIHVPSNFKEVLGR